MYTEPIYLPCPLKHWRKRVDCKLKIYRSSLYLNLHWGPHTKLSEGWGSITWRPVWIVAIFIGFSYIRSFFGESIEYFYATTIA